MESAVSDLVTTREAMELAGFANPSSIARLVYEHKLTPARQLPGANGSYLFRRVDIVELAEARRAKNERRGRRRAIPTDNSPPAPAA